MTQTLTEILREPGFKLPRTSRELAIRTVQEIDTTCRPVKWPPRPRALAMIGGDAGRRLARDVMDGEVPKGEEGSGQVVEYREMQAWMVARSTALAENTARLRGLIWAITTLDACGRDDERAAQFADLARGYAGEVWGLPAEMVPQSTRVDLRQELAESMCLNMHRKSFV